MENSIKNRLVYLSLMAFLFCFTANVEAQVTKRVITTETVTVRKDVCLKGTAHKYNAVNGKRVLVKKRVKPTGTKKFVCATGGQKALRAKRVAKKRTAVQNRKKVVQVQKKSVQRVAVKQ